MRYFIKKFFVFLIGLIIIGFLYIFSFNLGEMDFYYKRISSPKQQSLILGNSRAAQGLVPSVFNRGLKGNYLLYNYSFAANYSPFGEVYYNSIINKVDPDTKNGIFIVTVDPGSISGPRENPNDASLFLDNRSFLAHLDCFSCNPNFDYILYGHETFYKKVFLNMVRGRGYLHDDGWLEMKIANDSISRLDRLNKTLADKGYANEYYLSDTRLYYLKETIKYLKEKGDVYLVRLPMHKEIIERQKKSMPEFETTLDLIANEYSIPYKSFADVSDQYQYADGSHLTPDSGKKISMDISNWINTYKP